MRLALDLSLPARAVLQTAGASAYASFAPPPGTHWEFVTFNGERVTQNGQPVVALVVN